MRQNQVSEVNDNIQIKGPLTNHKRKTIKKVHDCQCLFLTDMCLAGLQLPYRTLLELLHMPLLK